MNQQFLNAKMQVEAFARTQRKSTAEKESVMEQNLRKAREIENLKQMIKDMNIKLQHAEAKNNQFNQNQNTSSELVIKVEQKERDNQALRNQARFFEEQARTFEAKCQHVEKQLADQQKKFRELEQENQNLVLGGEKGKFAKGITQIKSKQNEQTK